MAATPKARRSQAERRAESRQSVLEAAITLFGQRGYADTSLEDIAEKCGLTIRPIYHYFGNKKALFAAVNESMEQRIVDSIAATDQHTPRDALLANYRSFLDLCDDPAFRRIVLIDSPNVLGRDRWAQGPVMRKAMVGTTTPTTSSARDFRKALMNRVLMAALAEVSLAVAEADNLAVAKREAHSTITALLEALLPPPS